jgi:antitoxin (DNA-binding transcriptional repressor) of toxin-antitoxin stability system
MLDHVRKGGSVVVTYGREKRPVAVLQPLPTRPKRKLGFLADQLKVTIGQNWELTEEEFLGS